MYARHAGGVTGVLKIVLVGLVVGSLAAIVAYLATFVAAVAWTMREARQARALSEELDRLVAEDLERVLPAILGEPGPAGVGDR